MNPALANLSQILFTKPKQNQTDKEEEKQDQSNEKKLNSLQTEVIDNKPKMTDISE